MTLTGLKEGPVHAPVDRTRVALLFLHRLAAGLAQRLGIGLALVLLGILRVGSELLGIFVLTGLFKRAKVLDQIEKVAAGCHQLGIGAGFVNAAIVHRDHLVAVFQVLDGVRHKKNRLATLAQRNDGIVKECFADMRIDRRQRVVETHNVGVVVQRTRNVQALLLATRERHTALANLGQVTVLQQLQVRDKLSSLDAVPVPGLIKRLTKNNVVTERRILDPGRL